MIQARKDVSTSKESKPEEQSPANPLVQAQRVVPIRTVHALDQRRTAFVTNALGTPSAVILSESGEGGTVQYRRVSIGAPLQHAISGVQVQGATATDAALTVNPRCSVSQQDLIQLICAATTSNLQTVDLQNSIVNAPQTFQTIGNVTNVVTSGQRINTGAVVGSPVGQISATLPQRIVLNSGNDVFSMRIPQGTPGSSQQIMVLDSSANLATSSDVTKVHSYSLASAGLTPTSVMQKVVIGTSGQSVQVQGHKTLVSHASQRTGVKRPLQASSAPLSSVNSSDILSHLSNVNKLLFCLRPCEGKVPSIPSSPKPKRMKVEKNIVGSRELTKRRKVAEHLTRKIQLLKIKHYQQQTEYFFLKNGGNLVDYIIWRKKIPAALLEYLKANRFEHQDDVKVISDILTQSTLQSILNPSLLSSGLLSDHSLSSKTISSHTTSFRSSFPSSPSQRPINASPSLPAASKNRQMVAVHRQLSKHNSISSVYDSQIASQEEIVQRAKQEAFVMQRINELRREGLWSLKRLPKFAEPPRLKAHYDYLLEEMAWLSTDFVQERKWKKAAAKKCCRMITKYFQEKEIKAEKAEKEEQARLRKIASTMAREIKHFWNNIEKLVEYKQQTWLEEKRKKVLDVHLNFIVDQTEKYSSWLTQGMNNPISSKEHSSSEFEASNSEDDDEETIEKAEKDVNEVEQSEEIKLLQQESEMPLEDFLDTLPPEILSNRASLDESKPLDESMDVQENEKVPESDDDFHGSDEEEDDEQTLLEQEQKEGSIDHTEELKELEAENEMSLEQLREKYAAAYASDFEMDTTEMDSESESESYDESLVDIASTISEDKAEDSLLKSLTSGDPMDKADNNPSKEISDIAATAESFQPKGNTLSTTHVCTKVPFLLKHQLREYQHIGLDWLNAMYEKKLNGILADEMGLGKTIQTISVLAHLACDKGVWGPHLIVVPTSVMLNWEMELKKWCPAFKILTYYGTPKERKQKRVGWTKPNAFHVCITSYKLVIQDHQSFRRKRWKYLILDEAQHIKNFKSQRWQMLLNFQTSHRLLLTGTPLQNNLMELWSLMHFLMPNVFQSHREFREWFVNPLTGMIEGSSEYNDSIIKRLHKILRPFLLRRLKCEVEKQLPKKYEHVIVCRLSKRQRYLYDDFMSQTKTKETLATGSFMSVINILMQLRKVCNHPNMFEERPTISPFLMEGITFHTASLAFKALEYDPFKQISLQSLNLLLSDLELSLTAFAAHRVRKYQVPPKLIVEIDSLPEPPPACPNVKMKINFCNSQASSAPATARVAPTAVRLTSPAAVRPPGPVLQQPSRFMFIPGQAPQTTPASRTTVPTTPTQSEHQYTLQLVQPGGALASLAPLSGFTLQLQPGPAGGTGRVQCIQSLIGGIGRVVQTAAGPHFVITSVANSVNPEQTPPLATAQPTASTVNTPASKMSIANVATPLLSSFNRTQQNSLPTSALTNQNVHNRPVGRVAPLNCHPPSNTPPTTTSSAVNQNHVQPAKNPVVHSLTKPSQKLEVPANTTEKKNSIFYLDSLAVAKAEERKNSLKKLARLNIRRCTACPIYGCDLVEAVTFMNNLNHPNNGCPWSGKGYVNCLNAVPASKNPSLFFNYTNALIEIIKTPQERLEELIEAIYRFVFVVPAVTSPSIKIHVSHPAPSRVNAEIMVTDCLQRDLAPKCSLLHPILSNNRTQFPELRLIQYDCGKLQRLSQLLWDLKSEHHRVLIFTQMTRMLDILEQFLNYHGHTYLRLDGNTKVEQRQALMERFNADKRIFCFILSTRSGGIGVNLTGADTVIFYDSDWNPTMDAQAQDRCHRIGQTRDVHIYRLISERTIEENILKKANQKRILGDLAIEGGNFTTAFFKNNTINELFGMEIRDAVAENKKTEITTEKSPAVDKFSSSQFEQALGMAEEESDIQAAKTASAEAVAELAEFDESIPLDNDSRDNEEKSPAEEEFEKLMEQLTPVEKYAVQFLESLQDNVSLEQLKLAEEEMEAQKKDWELGHLKALKEEEERRLGSLDDDSSIYFSREVSNQILFSVNGQEEMPTWAPPTPPTNENDIYIDHTTTFWYEPSFMHETRLPPIFIKKEAKRQKIDAVVSAVSTTRKQKVRKDDMVNIPRSLFDRPSAAILKMRREVKLQKVKGLMAGGLAKPLANFTGLKQPGLVLNKPSIEPHLDKPDWLVQEDWAILQVIQDIQGIPLNLTVLLPAHIPNWDLTSEAVFAVSRNYRSAKACRARYENVIVPREEGKILYDTNPKKQKKTKGIYKTKNNRPMKTSQLYIQDNNSAASKVFIERHKLMLDIVTKKKTNERASYPQTPKVPKLSSVLAETGMNFDQILTPMQIAANRADRILREKQTKQQGTGVTQTIPSVPVQAQVQQVVTSQNMPPEQQVNQRQVIQQAPVTVASAANLIPQQVIASIAQQQLQQAVQLNKASLQPGTVTSVSLAKSLASSIMVNAGTGTPTAGTLATLSKALGQVASISSQGSSAQQNAAIAAALSNAGLRGPRATVSGTTTMSVQEMVAAAAANLRASTTVVGSTSTAPAVVSVSNLAAVQLAQQRLPTTTTPTSGTVAQLTSQVAANQRSMAQLSQIQAIRQNALIRQREQHNLKQQQHLKRLQTVQQQAVGAKQVAGQVQQRVAGQQVKQRTMTEAEVTQLMKRQKQAQLSGVLGQQQQQVSATLVKTVSAAPSLAIPVSAVTMGGVNINVSVPTSQGKLGTVQAKGATTITNQQLRQFQIHHQLLNQARKGNKMAANLQLTKQVAAGNKATVQGAVQIVPGGQQQQVKGLPTTMTVQQIQQAMKQAMPQGNLPVVVTATPSLTGVQQQAVVRGEVGVKQAQTTALSSTSLTTSTSGGVQLKGGVVVGGQAALLQQVASGQAGQLTLAVRAQGSSQPQQLQIQVQQSGQQVRMQQLGQGASISIAQPITVQQSQAAGILPTSANLVQQTQHVNIQQQTPQQRLQLSQASISIAQPVSVQQSTIISPAPLQQQQIQVSTDPTQIVMQGVATTSSLQTVSTTAQAVQAAIQVARQQQQQAAQAAAAAQKASPYTMRLRNPPK